MEVVTTLLARMDETIRAIARRIAAKFGLDWNQRQDLLQCGRIAVWKNANGHTPGRGTLEAFLAACARNAMYSELRTWFGCRRGGMITTASTVSMPNLFQVYDRPDHGGVFREYFDGLSDAQAGFLEDRFVEGADLKEIGRRRGLSKGWAFLEERRILGKLRGGLGR